MGSSTSLLLSLTDLDEPPVVVGAQEDVPSQVDVRGLVAPVEAQGVEGCVLYCVVFGVLLLGGRRDDDGIRRAGIPTVHALPSALPYLTE